MKTNDDYVDEFRQKWEGANVHSNSICTPVMNEMIEDIRTTLEEVRREERERIRKFFEASSDDWSINSDNWILLDELLTQTKTDKTNGWKPGDTEKIEEYYKSNLDR